MTEIDRLFSAAYEELRRLAAQMRSKGATPTLNPTALVNEVYVKLSAAPELRAESELHFKRIAARAMRQVLVDASRERRAVKRGAGYDRVTLDESRAGVAVALDDVMVLDQALERLAAVSPRQAQLFECRFFGGMKGSECARALGVSEATVDREWRAAKAWLALQLKRR